MRQLILSLLIFHLAACSSMHAVSVRDVQAGSESSPVQVGDRVKIITKSNEKLDFAVTDLTPQGIGGKFGFIPYDNIQRLMVNVPSTSDDSSYTWLWVLLGIGVTAALVASADSVTVCSGSPCPITGND